jgi:hypothetical protein
MKIAALAFEGGIFMTMGRTVGVSLLLGAGLLAASCVLPDYKADRSGGGGGGGTSATGTGGMVDVPGADGSGGGSVGASGGGALPCSSDADCHEHPVICHEVRCVQGSCKASAITDSQTEQKPDALGDCKKWTCQGGQLHAEPDDADTPDDDNECTNDTCDGQTPLLTIAEDTACSGGKCNKEGTCGSCVPFGNDCPADSFCQSYHCVSNACNDGSRNNDETDIDCGGSCSPCAAGKGCNVAEDCASHVCKSGKCAAPSCTDGVQNGSESDMDCGGSCGRKCKDDEACRKGDDCKSGVCRGGQCRAATCYDNVENGGEEGLDCGDDCPFACP